MVLRARVQAVQLRARSPRCDSFRAIIGVVSACGAGGQGLAAAGMRRCKSRVGACQLGARCYQVLLFTCTSLACLLLRGDLPFLGVAVM